MSFKWLKAPLNSYQAIEKAEESQKSLAGETEDSHKHATPQQNTARLSQFWKVREIIQIATCILCIWVLLAFSWQNDLWRSGSAAARFEKKTLSCGNSTDEAKERGCVFDLLANNWVPPQCLDPYTESEYRSWLFSAERAHGPFPFFFDIEGTQRVPDEHRLSMHADGQTEHERRVYTTREQHLNHCIFVLKRLHRAMEGKARLNDEHGAMAHTEHCATQLFLDNESIMNKLVEECYIGFSTCTIDVPL